MKRRIVALALVVSCLIMGALTYSPAKATIVITPPSSLTPPGVPASQFSQTNANGMNIDQAETTYTSGDPRTLIAYIEGGINLHDKGFASKIDPALYVNWHSTPVPCTGTTLATATMIIGGVTKPCATYYSNSESDYDVNHDGVVNALDWKNDPRVTDSNGNGVIDPEDLIAAFSDGQVHDSTGFKNDIFGWDFYENQNDPATQDGAYGHADGQMDVLHSLCPNCMIMPIRAGDEALDAGSNLAQAWTYACTEGANIIVSVTADLGYSTAMMNAINYCNSKGVIMIESSNDFDSQDHQGGMHWPYVIPGNGLVSNVNGLPSSIVSTIPDRYWTRSDETSWGPHAMFSVATYGGSTSESTPTTGAVLGLILSEGYKAYDNHQIPAPLTGQQAVQILRETASPITSTALSWPGGPGDWNPQYGYGMPNVDLAMQQVANDQIPPTAQITSPEWYQMYDPTTTASVPITGSITDPSNGSFTWSLEAGIGETPSSWFPIGTGSGSGSYSGNVGNLNLSQIPASYYTSAMTLSTDKELSTADQYDVTLKLVVTDSNNLQGVDRRVIETIHDPSWVKGFPMYLGPGGESQPALVDLQGTGHLDIVFANSDGTISAIDPTTGKELPGWPQHTLPLVVAGNSVGVNFGDEEVLQPVAVGDLFHTGQLDVVVTSLSGHVYAFNAYGQELPGWPKVADKNVPTLAIPRPDNPYTRSPIQGAISPPQLADLTGNGTLDVIQTGLDGYIHVWQPDGTDLPGWPVKVTMPSNFQVKTGYNLINDSRLISGVAVAYFNGKNQPPSLVVRSQVTEVQGGGIQPLPLAFAMAYNLSGQELPGWPVQLQGLVEYYGSAMDALTEGISSPITLPTPTVDQVIIDPLWTTPYIVNGDGTIAGSIGNLGAAATSLLSVFQNTGLVLTPSKLPPDAPIPFDNYGSLGSLNGQLDYVSSEMGATSFAAGELVTSSGIGINNYEVAYPASVGINTISGYPTMRQGADFLGGPAVASVSSNGQEDIIDGGDGSTLTAYDGSGNVVPGFPKYTGGWVVGTPAVGDLFSTGSVDVVATTRDGYLMAWQTPGPTSANNQWWHGGGNDYNQNSYGVDTRPPGVIQNASWPGNSSTVSFIAPGNDWYSGQADHYNIILEPSGQVITEPATVSSGNVQTLSIPAGVTSVEIQAVDAAGNLATPVTVSIGAVGVSTSSGSPIPNALTAQTGKPIEFEVVMSMTLLLGGSFIILFLRKKQKRTNAA